MNVRLKRAYAGPGANDGYRVLVDRLWPRGISKKDARIDDWWRDCAPSTELRKWFHHDASKWALFKQRYAEELEGKRETLKQLVSQVGHRRITLVYGAKDEQHNHAVVLKEFLEGL